MLRSRSAGLCLGFSQLCVGTLAMLGCLGSERALRGKTRQDAARHGKTRQDAARRGRTRQDAASGKTRQGAARRGKARQDAARRGLVKRISSMVSLTCVSVESTRFSMGAHRNHAFYNGKQCFLIKKIIIIYIYIYICFFGAARAGCGAGDRAGAHKIHVFL